MKILLTISILAFTSLSFAGPVGFATVSGTITTAAWTQIVSGVTKAASSVMISNTGSSFLLLGVGPTGFEVNTGLLIAPSSAPILVPISISKGSRLSVKALHNNQTGVTGMVFFQ